ncbi:alpha/beta fold hydrolase (plasmid) [Deinococcus radiomollis]|uniref:alpha/beta fold hydrolase n=1 Tax=Deinococcus radiomollis TaxID=468916 RepID=UPI003891F37A
MSDDTRTVLLPGTLCDAALWSGVSLPSGAEVLNTVGGTSLAQAAASALHLAPGPVHLVGFSLGALIAFEVLRLAPERVARLTLIAANPHAPTRKQLDAWAEQERAVLAGEFGKLVSTLVPAEPQGVLEMALRVGPETFLEQLHLLRSRPDSRSALTGYTGPLTVLVGENDTTTPPSLAVELRALAPQARLRQVPGAGHYLPLDAPQCISDALREPAYA